MNPLGRWLPGFRDLRGQQVAELPAIRQLAHEELVGGAPDSDGTPTARVTDLMAARIRRRRVLGGLIHEYERAA